MTVPVDVFYEIASHLLPIDLLRLSRASKFIRSVLMSRQAKGVWSRSLSNVDMDLPACPEDLCEPAYASFVFETWCQGCNAPSWYSSDYSTRIRVCLRCFKDVAVTFDDIIDKHVLELLKPLLPYSYDQRLSCPFFARAMLFELQDALSATKDDPDALAVLVAERANRAQLIKAHASLLRRWRGRVNIVKDTQKRDITTRRREAIKEKMVELGWDTEYNLAGVWLDKDFRRMARQPRELTPLIWKRLQPKILGILKQRKAKAIVLGTGVPATTGDATI